MTQEGLRDLVRQLPEIYQPLYGLPEYPSSRPADGVRDSVIDRVVEAVCTAVGRPLRVLDLGSAQGFLAFRLAEQGHHVTGIDFEPTNVAVSEAIAKRNPHLDVAFHHGDINEAGRIVELDQFDLVLAFSVLHHLAHRDGHHAAQELVADLARSIPHALFEMARREEPVYWADALAEDPRITLSPYGFLRELGRSTTHLSEIQRPIIFGSQTHVLLSNGLHPFRSRFTRSHRHADPEADGARRYFLLDGAIVKTAGTYAAESPAHIRERLRLELRREVNNLQTLRSTTDVELPDVIEFSDGHDETLLARTMLSGSPLDELAGALTEPQRVEVTRQLLETLSDLERHGLFHTDLRMWNLLWDSQSERLHLIDYGSIDDQLTDVVWPHDAHFSLLALLTALWGKVPERTGASAPRISNFGTAELGPVPSALAIALLSHQRDASVIADVSRRFEELLADAPASPAKPLAWHWLAALEREHDRLVGEIDDRQVEQTRLESANERLRAELEAERERYAEVAGRLDELAHRTAELRRHADAVTADRDRLAAEVTALTADRDAHALELRSARSELEQIRGSRIWRAAQPVRSAAARLRDR